MNLTARIKKWLIENAGVKSTDSDEVFLKAAGEKVASGELTPELLVTLTKKVKSGDSNDDEDANVSLLKEVKDTLKDLKSLFENADDDEDENKPEDKKSTKKGKKSSPKPTKSSDEDDEDEEEDEGEKSVKGKKGKKPPKTDDMDEDEEDDEEEEMPAGKPKKNAGNKSEKTGLSALEKTVSNLHRGGFNQDDPSEDGSEKSTFSIQIKKAIDQYDNTKSTLVYPGQTGKGRSHPLAGKQVVDYNEPGKGRALNTASDRDKAIAGSFSKFLVNSAKLKSKSLAFMQLPQHDKEILLYAMENEKWGGASDGGDFADIKERKLTPHEQKALIDDASSGGLEAAPIVFDDMVIQTPLLNGELFPLVNTIPLDRGRRVEGVAIGTVTGSWGGVDDTEIDLFDTTSYVTAFDTTIFRWQGAIRVGLDFLGDTPIDFGQQLTSQYGERLLEDLDNVIAIGNGTNQPEGVMIKGGTTSINFGGTTSLGSYEALRFGVAKAEHRANVKASAVFCGTEISYERARAIPVGANDARRLGGSLPSIGGVTDYDSYQWMGIPFKINEAMANNQLFYAILARYRMYRRRGLAMRTSTEGDTLIRRNEMLMVAMARYGGQLERGAVAAVTSTAPA